MVVILSQPPRLSQVSKAKMFFFSGCCVHGTILFSLESLAIQIAIYQGSLHSKENVRIPTYVYVLYAL